jgi:hypothetical protein
MGYTTDFEGSVRVEPPLNRDEIEYLMKFSGTRRMKRGQGPYFVLGTGSFGQGDDPDIEEYNHPPEGQPGLWCQWVPTEDGTEIVWNGSEKFYESAEWMHYLIDHFLRPGAQAKTQTHGGPPFTFADHVLNGRINAQGEDIDDRWTLVVRENVVESLRGLPDEMYEILGPV